MANFGKGRVNIEEQTLSAYIMLHGVTKDRSLETEGKGHFYGQWTEKET